MQFNPERSVQGSPFTPFGETPARSSNTPQSTPISNAAKQALSQSKGAESLHLDHEISMEHPGHDSIDKMHSIATSTILNTVVEDLKNSGIDIAALAAKAKDIQRVKLPKQDLDFFPGRELMGFIITSKDNKQTFCVPSEIAHRIDSEEILKANNIELENCTTVFVTEQESRKIEEIYTQFFNKDFSEEVLTQPQKTEDARERQSQAHVGKRSHETETAIGNQEGEQKQAVGTESGVDSKKDALDNLHKQEIKKEEDIKIHEQIKEQIHRSKERFFLEKQERRT